MVLGAESSGGTEDAGPVGNGVVVARARTDGYGI